MFIDLSNLVSMQGEMVDRIEDHINSEYHIPV
jgi:t-SNARE complex subunit (syntaxin)